MFYLLFFLLIIEQFFYIFLNVYPYEHGIIIKRIKLSSLQKQLLEKLILQDVEGLLIKMTSKKDIYLRYKYPKFVGGPFLFTGHITQQSDILKIRIGFFSLSFLIYLVSVSFFPIGLHTIAIFLCVVCIIYFSFRRFKKKLDLAILSCSWD